MWRISILLLCLSCFPSHADTITLRVAVSDAPPYRIIESPLFRGYYIELLQLAARNADLRVQFVSVPLKRAFQMLENGEADLMLGPNRTPEREQFLVYLEQAPFPAEDKVFLISDPGQIIRSLDDLHGKRLDVLAGAVYHPDIDNDPQILRHEVKNYSQALQRLIRQRSDVVLIPEAQGDWLMHEMGLHLIKSPLRLAGKPSYVVWSRRTYDAALAKRLIHGLQQAFSSHAGAAIQQRYFPTKPSPAATVPAQTSTP